MTDSNSPSETKYVKGYMCLSFDTIFRNKCGKKLTCIAIKTETDEKNCIKRKWFIKLKFKNVSEEYEYFIKYRDSLKINSELLIIID